MAGPVPIYCSDSAGSGFLISDGTNIWLMTCVHLISGKKETPLIASFFTTAEIRVAGTAGVIPLFVEGRQRFSVVKNETTGNLVDAIAIRLMPREIASLISFGMYEAGLIEPAEVGETVTASGFAGLGQQMASGATAFDPTVVQYEVDEVAGVSIRLSKPGAGGLSGGPVVNEVGLIGIMHGDLGVSTEMTNALVIALDVVADQLLR